MLTFLIRSATSQSNSCPIVLTRLGGPRSKPNSHLKFVRNAGDRTHDLMISSQTYWPLDQLVLNLHLLSWMVCAKCVSTKWLPTDESILVLIEIYCSMVHHCGIIAFNSVNETVFYLICKLKRYIPITMRWTQLLKLAHQHLCLRCIHINTSTIISMVSFLFLFSSWSKLELYRRLSTWKMVNIEVIGFLFQLNSP